MKFRSPVLALSLALVSMCAWAQTPAPAAAVPAPEKQEDRLPKQELTGQILYQFLFAEIAAQRGQFGLSAGAYLDLAKSTRDPRVVRRAAEIAFHARQYDAALEAVRLWLSLEPASQQAKQMEATLLLANGRIDELAGNLARDLAAEAPNIGDALIRMMRAFARYPDKPAVQRLFDQLTEPYPALPEARLIRAQVAAAAGNPDRARSETDQALALRPNWELAALFKAELLPKGAAQLDFLKTWLAANPDGQQARLAYARGLVAEKQYEAARVEFRRLLTANPDIPDILYAVGVLSLQVNDVPEAEQQLKRFVEIGRGDLNPARFYLGQIADQDKRPDEALRWYDQVTAGEHAMPAMVRATQVLLRQDRFDEARARPRPAPPQAPPPQRGGGGGAPRGRPRDTPPGGGGAPPPCPRAPRGGPRGGGGARPRRARMRRTTCVWWWPRPSCCAMPGATRRPMPSWPRCWKPSRISPTSFTRRRWPQRSWASWMTWSATCGA